MGPPNSDLENAFFTSRKCLLLNINAKDSLDFLYLIENELPVIQGMSIKKTFLGGNRLFIDLSDIFNSNSNFKPFYQLFTSYTLSNDQILDQTDKGDLLVFS